MAASPASSSSPVQQVSAPVRPSTSARAQDRVASFTEALEAQERQLGEPERDSRVARARQQRKPAVPGEANLAIEAATPQTIDNRPVTAPDDKMADSVEPGQQKTGKDAPQGEAPAGEPVDAVAAAEVPATTAPAPNPAGDAAAVPVQAPAATADATAETAIAATAEGTVAISGATAEAKAAVQPAIGGAVPEAGASVADPAARPEAAKPDGTPAKAETMPAQPSETLEATGGVVPPSARPAEPKAEASDKAAARADIRHADQGPPPAPENTPRSAAEAPQPTAPQTATPAASGPTSFAAEVAQKVAAQTSAAGSVVPVHALAVTIAARASTGATRFDIRLDPPELGRIDVQLTVDREGRVKSKLVVEKQETLDLLQRDQRNLERALSQAGVQTNENSLEFSLKDQNGQQPRDRQSDDGARRHQIVVEDADTAALQASAATYARAAALRGGVDIRI